MNDPVNPHVDLQGAVRGPRSIASDGCLKPLLLGCGSIAFFLGIALFVLVLRADDLLRWTLETVESQVVSVMPEEIDAAQRERLSEAFVVSREALANGQVDSADLQRFQGALIDYSRAAVEGLSVNDVDRLIDALESLGGVSNDSGPPDPSQDTKPRTQAAPVAIVLAPGGSG